MILILEIITIFFLSGLQILKIFHLVSIISLLDHMHDYIGSHMTSETKSSFFNLQGIHPNKKLT